MPGATLTIRKDNMSGEVVLPSTLIHENFAIVYMPQGPYHVTMVANGITRAQSVALQAETAVTLN